VPGADAFPELAIACGEEASDPLVLHDGQVVRVSAASVREQVP
jgi:hypothetical protein